MNNKHCLGPFFLLPSSSFILHPFEQGWLMSWITRTLSCALTAVVLLAAGLFLTHTDAGHYGRGAGGAPYRVVAAEARRLEKLEREQRETERAQRGREEVMDALVAGRCSLPEAAAAFWEWNRSMSNFKWENFRRAFPAATEGERCCRHVIRHVACRLEEEPDGGAAVLRRLEAELEECLRRGPVLLPGVEEPAPPGR